MPIIDKYILHIQNIVLFFICMHLFLYIWLIFKNIENENQKGEV
jgi:hypothetical protein